MKFLQYIFLVFLLPIALCGCRKGFLQVEDQSAIIRQQYVKDLKTTQEFLNGIYLVFSQDFIRTEFQVYPDVIADDIKPKPGSSRMAAHYNWSQMADISQNPLSSPNMNSFWRVGYQLIASCNFVLAKATEFRNANTVDADDMKGQAYAIRAFVHFSLVNIFAQHYKFTNDASHIGIPYVTTYGDTKPVIERNSVAQVYTNIISDLLSAIPLFKTGAPNILTFNRNAARALLARVYLFKEDFSSAKNIAGQVASDIPLMPAGINEYPSKLFTPSDKEALFQLKPAYVGITAGAGNFYTTFEGSAFDGQSSFYFQFLATTSIAGILTENSLDVRKSWINNGGFGKDTIKKYPVNIIAGFSPTSHSYYPDIFRSSEMYLIASEAYAKLNMEDSARFYLDAIRKRASSLALPTTATGTPLQDSIYKERRKELAFEGFRMFDLLRLKRGVTRSADVNNGASLNLPYPSSKVIAPVPLQDVQTGDLKQNADY